MRYLAAALFASMIAVAPALAEQKVTMASLPAAVQAAVKAETANATVLNISKETEKGKTVYEVESKVNGKTRDFMVDAAGRVYSIEEEMDLASVPPAVKQTIEKQSAGATVKRIEKLTEGTVVSYEVALTRKGKSSEIHVNGDGTIKK